MSRLSQRLRALVGQTQSPSPLMFGTWAPDLPDLGNSCTLAKNVIPAIRSYRPFKGLEAQSDALDTKALGLIASRDTSSNSYVYAADAAKIYELRDQTLTDKSKAGGYSTAAGDHWEMEEFEGQVIGTNFTDDVQVITTGDAGLFADLITSTEKPKAKTIAKIRDFLFLGNIESTADGTKPKRIHWSAFRDATDFDPDATTQCDFNDITDGGEVQKIVGGVEFGLVFMQSAVQRVTFTGDETVFDIFPIDRKRGTPIPRSAVGYGRRAFFISEEGFFANDGASESVAIGHDQIDRWFWDQFDIGNASNVSSAIDPFNKLVVWSFPGSGSAQEPNRLLLYHWNDQKWSFAEIDTEMVSLAETQAYTLEGLDAISGSDIDSMTLSLDDPAWAGGLINFAAFDTTHKLSYFSGPNLAARVESGDYQLSPGRRSLARKLRPLVDGTASAANIGGRAKLADANSFDVAAPQDGIGEVSQRNDSRYHRFQVTTDAGDTWDHIQGVEAAFTTRGGR